MSQSSNILSHVFRGIANLLRSNPILGNCSLRHRHSYCLPMPCPIYKRDLTKTADPQTHISQPRCSHRCHRLRDSADWVCVEFYAMFALITPTYVIRHSTKQEQKHVQRHSIHSMSYRLICFQCSCIFCS